MSDKQADTVAQQLTLHEVAVDAIRPNPQQPREHFDEQGLADLARSIQEHGVLQPLLVTRQADGYELIAGERRWRAARLAGLARVPVIVKEASAQRLLELAIIENVQRADLNPIEEARAYQALKDEFGLADSRIAELVGQKKRETIANTRRLLALSPKAQQALLDGKISAGHGRALLMIKHVNPEQERLEQDRALERVMREGLSVRQVEQLVYVLAHPEEFAEPAAARREPRERATQADESRAQQPAQSRADDAEIVAQLEQQLGTRVVLQRGPRESRLVIMFYDDEQLHELYQRLHGPEA